MKRQIYIKTSLFKGIQVNKKSEFFVKVFFSIKILESKLYIVKPSKKNFKRRAKSKSLKSRDSYKNYYFHISWKKEPEFFNDTHKRSRQ